MYSYFKITKLWLWLLTEKSADTKHIDHNSERDYKVFNEMEKLTYSMDANVSEFKVNIYYCVIFKQL